MHVMWIGALVFVASSVLWMVSFVVPVLAVVLVPLCAMGAWLGSIMFVLGMNSKMRRADLAYDRRLAEREYHAAMREYERQQAAYEQQQHQQPQGYVQPPQQQPYQVEAPPIVRQVRR